MTLSLTFDDGLRAHSTIAAPKIRRYGWNGAFNVCTDFLDPKPTTLTKEKLAVLGLSNNRDCRMNWADVKVLLDDGHEVYPHSCTHERLGVLAEEGRMEELWHEIKDSREVFVRNLGIQPRYFCCPHLDWNPAVRDVIHACGMKMFNNWRSNIGGDNAKDCEGIILRHYRDGRRHIDLMFHGIVAREGGYKPFADEAEFEGVLMAIKKLEDNGLVRVVPYSKARRGYLLTKMRRVLFRLFPALAYKATQGI